MTDLRAAQPDDAEAITDIHRRCWDAIRAQYPAARRIPEETHAHHLARWRAILAVPPKTGVHTFVAMRHGDLGGFVTAGPQRSADMNERGYPAEIYSLYVDPDRHRGGLGGALLRGAARHLDQAGHTGMALWAMRENGAAREFYAAMGGREVTRQTTGDPGHEVEDVGYGWADLAHLATEA